MTMPTATTSRIELKDFHLATRIGTYAPSDTVPDYHALDLTLWINPDLVLIAQDGMAHVFDYDPLVVEIERLAADGLYDTQERLMTRIVQACAAYPAIQALEMAFAQISGAGGQRFFGRAFGRRRRTTAAHARHRAQGVSHSQVLAPSCARRCPSRDSSSQSI
jgi:dihydroneopterin aldolase